MVPRAYNLQTPVSESSVQKWNPISFFSFKVIDASKTISKFHPFLSVSILIGIDSTVVTIGFMMYLHAER